MNHDQKNKSAKVSSFLWVPRVVNQMVRPLVRKRIHSHSHPLPKHRPAHPQGFLGHHLLPWLLQSLRTFWRIRSRIVDGG